MINNCIMIRECEGFDPGFKLFGKTIPVCCSPSDDMKKPCASKQEEAVIVQSSSPAFNKEKDNACVEGEEEVGSGQKDDSNEGKDGENSALKKPDKLVPCPRCESMDTKFCYYNNYNVNQPRHFCKNCQRYWTAGGSLRNVPVGAGRRKNKHSISPSPHYRPIRSPGLRIDDHGSPMKMIQIDESDSGATVLNFGRDKTTPSGGDSQRLQVEQQQSRDEISCGSSVTGESGTAGDVNPQMDGLKRPNGTVPAASPATFITGPWSYGAWGSMPWPMVQGSPFGGWATGPWIPAPWAIAAPAMNNVSNSHSHCGSPTLGKRAAQPEEGGLYVPKTLRIEDPREAAMSSIWATLGLGSKSELSGGSDSFQRHPKTEALRANPAAFSRSISFQETN